MYGERWDHYTTLFFLTFFISDLINPWKPSFRVKQFFFSWLKTFFFQVMHSKRLNEAPLKPWVIAWSSGEILLQLHGWLGRGLYPCCILAFLDWNLNKNQRIFYCNRPSFLLVCTIKSNPSPTTKNSGHWLSSSKKKKTWNFPLYSSGSTTG